MAACRNICARREGFHSAETVGVLVSPGVDEIALALTADVYSRTYRGVKALTVAISNEPVRSLGGLTLVPDRLLGGSGAPDRMLAPLGSTPSMQVLEEALSRVSDEHGRAAAASAAYDLEYSRTNQTARLPFIHAHGQARDQEGGAPRRDQARRPATTRTGSSVLNASP